MRAAEADILMVPDHHGADGGHWQTRWERKLKTAAPILRAGWSAADIEELQPSLIAHAKAATRPVVLVAHGCGAIVAVQAAAHLAGAVRAAFLVAPPDLAIPYAPEPCRALGPAPRERCRSRHSSSPAGPIPICSFEASGEMARAWNSLLIDAGSAGHIDTASGHGPWPEGLLIFSRLLRSLQA